MLESKTLGLLEKGMRPGLVRYREGEGTENYKPPPLHCQVFDERSCEEARQEYARVMKRLKWAEILGADEDSEDGNVEHSLRSTTSMSEKPSAYRRDPRGEEPLYVSRAKRPAYSSPIIPSGLYQKAGPTDSTDDEDYMPRGGTSRYRGRLKDVFDDSDDKTRSHTRHLPSTKEWHVDNIDSDVEQTRLDDLRDAKTDGYYAALRESEKMWKKEVDAKVRETSGPF
jgi:hypothetical protein